MFAVPGWSVSANQLKTQTSEKSKPAKNGIPAPNDPEDSGSKSGKKRKRSSGKSKAKDVNSSNLSDMWEKVIEGKTEPKEKGHSEKRQKVAEDLAGSLVVESAESEKKSKKTKKEKKDGPRNEKDAQIQEGSIVDATNSTRSPAIEENDVPVEAVKIKKSKKEKKKERRISQIDAKDDLVPTKAIEESPSEPALKAIAPPKPTTQLTPLQASMRQKLISARFRHLNQTLYTTPSAHSLSLFQDNPEMFTEYHEGFRKQVEVWPENPVNGYIEELKARGKVRGPQQGKGKQQEAKDAKLAVQGPHKTPLPRTAGTCHIADLGCGDAQLSSSLQPQLKKLNFKVHSFDLQSPSPLVTKADIANLPLADGSIDVAIFCLALMGTNWIDFIEEASRILHWKGELWIAEIKSRFRRVKGAKDRVDHSVGNRKRPSGQETKANKKDAKKLSEAANDEIAAVEVDGLEPANQETDVSAFVEVLRKRGFVLKQQDGDMGKGAVDLSNRMFVKMTFLKALTPIKGKCVPVPKGMETVGSGETWKKKSKGKFVDEEENHVSSEAAVLKPCVYKLR